jgi:hypothetical protein
MTTRSHIVCPVLSYTFLLAVIAFAADAGTAFFQVRQQTKTGIFFDLYLSKHIENTKNSMP